MQPNPSFPNLLNPAGFSLRRENEKSPMNASPIKDHRFSLLRKVISSTEKTVAQPQMDATQNIMAQPSALRYHCKRYELLVLFKDRLRRDNIVDSLWGVSLDLGRKDERIDVILLKFLKFKRYGVNDSYALLTKVLDWRKKYLTHIIKGEVFDLESIFGKCIFIHGKDKENRPLLYIRYSAITDLDRARLVLSDSAERERFVQGRIQLFERAIALLDFKDGGADSVIEVSDLTGMSHTGIDLAVKEYQRLIIDYYPCLVGRKIYITGTSQCYNFLRALVAYPRLVPNDKGRNRVIFASKANCYSTLFKFISPEYILEDYRFSKRGQNVQTPNLGKTGREKHGEIVKKHEAHEIRIWGIPADTTTTWTIFVYGWDIKYTAEFFPDGAPYSISLVKGRYYGPDTGVITENFKWHGAGKLVLTLDNTDSGISKELEWQRWFSVEV